MSQTEPPMASGSWHQQTCWSEKAENCRLQLALSICGLQRSVRVSGMKGRGGQWTGRARGNHVHLSPTMLCKHGVCRCQGQEALRASALTT